MKNGRKPGGTLYWRECEEQVKGFSGDKIKFRDSFEVDEFYE
ncbi:viroplasmin family protein (plasmid) [Clostridium baratii]